MKKMMITLLTGSLLGVGLFMGAQEADAQRYRRNSRRSNTAHSNRGHRANRARSHRSNRSWARRSNRTRWNNRRAVRNNRWVRNNRRAVRHNRRVIRNHRRWVRNNRRAARRWRRSVLRSYWVLTSHLGWRARRILNHRYHNNVQLFCSQYTGYCSVRYRRVFF